MFPHHFYCTNTQSINMYKLGGYKTKYLRNEGYEWEEYTIYCALESTTDVWRYKMFDKNGVEHDISVSAEDDVEAFGNSSLIDCLYHLKTQSNMTFPNYKDNNIIIEEMTNEEMRKVFG